jgi:hypothetical protein
LHCDKGEGSFSYLGGWDSPNLVVVWSHEEVGNTGTHHSHNPLIEVLWLGAGDTSLQGGIDHALNALDLVLLWKDGDVVLEWVWDPEALAANVGDTLVGVPIILLWKGLVNAVVEVLVVGEDNVATDIVELEPSVAVCFQILDFWYSRNLLG